MAYGQKIQNGFLYLQPQIDLLTLMRQSFEGFRVGKASFQTGPKSLMHVYIRNSLLCLHAYTFLVLGYVISTFW